MISAHPKSSTPRFSRRVVYLPVVVTLLYLVTTTLLFAFGPWRYAMPNAWVYAYLAAAHLAFAAGFVSGARVRPATDRWQWSPSRLALVSVAVTAALLLPTSLHNTGSVLPDVLTGIRDPGGAYARSFALTQNESDLTPVSYARVLAGPLLYMAWPLTIFYWRRLNPVVRALGVTCVLFTIATFIAMGSNKSIVDSLLIFPWIFVAANASGVVHLNRRWTGALATGWVVSMALWLSFFASTQEARLGSASLHGVLPPATPSPLAAATSTPSPSTPSPLTTSAPPSNPPTASATTAPTFAPPTPTALARVDNDNFLVRLVPDGRARVGLVGVDSYVTQGYFALSLALEKPFFPMWGVGNSFFATRQAARLLHRDDIIDLPYPMRLRADGWDPIGRWSSIYPWIASDVSFPGSIVIVFLIGWLFAVAWRDTLGGNNPFAVVMVALLLIMIFYFPANNQVLQFGEGFTAFWFTLVLWLTSRRRGPASGSPAR